MDKELQEKIFKAFPDLFVQRHLPMTQTCMCWGIDVGAGWYKIIMDLCRKISKFCYQEDIKVEFSQVKEKYGLLRVYYDIKGASAGEDKIIQHFIDEAEHRSAKVCEVCGGVGRMNRKGWLSVRCDDCRKDPK